jgi:hypothetical protein
MNSRTCGTSLLLATLLTMLAPRAHAADVPINDDARAHFNAGVNLLQDPDGPRYEEAYREFKAAYAAAPSWKILGNLGIAAMKLERDGEAIEAFKKYLAEGGSQLDPDEKAQVERDLTTLESGVVRLTLSSDPPGALLLDERFPATGNVIQNSYGPLDASMVIGIHPGRHRITARLPGRKDAVWEVELSPKQHQSHAFKLEDAAGTVAPAAEGASLGTADVPRGNGLRIGSYIALGVGVVGVGAGTFFALSAKKNYDDGNDLCPSFPCELTSDQAQDREDFGEKGDTAKTLSLVSFIVGGVGLGTGVTLFVLSNKQQEQPPQARVEPFLGLGSAGVRGSF